MTHQNKIENIKQGNISEGNIQVNLNERSDNRQFKLIHTVHGLREE